VVAVNPDISPYRLRAGQVIQLPGQVDLGNARPVQSVKPVSLSGGVADDASTDPNGSPEAS
jgi:hypothetical protein